MAEQEEPVRRRVALKVIRIGMDTREVIARFEAERQALALMDHHGHRLAVLEGDEDVRRLDVAVDDPLLVRVLDGMADLGEEVQALGGR